MGDVYSRLISIVFGYPFSTLVCIGGTPTYVRIDPEPVGPVAPAAPLVPFPPVGPVGPVIPWLPCAPAAPAAPAEPLDPVGPVGPGRTFAVSA